MDESEEKQSEPILYSLPKILPLRQTPGGSVGIDRYSRENYESGSIESPVSTPRKHISIGAEYSPNKNLHLTPTKGAQIKNEAQGSSSLKPCNKVPSVKLPIAGVSVEFPCEPYPVQKYMMNQILNALNKAQHCLLESPTGTGKTLALLCSSLAWQKKESELVAELKKQAEEMEEITFNNATKEKKRDMLLSKLNSPVQTANKCTAKPETPCSNSSDDEMEWFQAPKRSKVTKSDSFSSSSVCNKDASNPAETTCCKSVDDKTWSNICAEGKPVDSTAGSGTNSELRSTDEAPETKIPRVPRIFFGSRTHKQIAQVVQQLKKTVYANEVRMTVLGSRDMTCVNSLAKQQKNIDEMCQSLLLPGIGGGCSYHEGQIKSHKQLANRGMPPVFDIEDMVRFGRKSHSCPYYTLRQLANEAQIIFCPYNYLIDPNIRESTGMNLDKDIVIIDEGHNIEDVSRDAGSLVLKEDMLEAAVHECDEKIKAYNKPGEYKVIKDYLQMISDWTRKNGSEAHYNNEVANFQMQNGEEIINKLHVEGITQEKYREFLENMTSVNTKVEEGTNESVMSGTLLRISRQIEKVFNYLYKTENMDKYKGYITREYGKKKPAESDTWLFAHKAGQKEWKYNLHVLCLSPGVVFGELLSARSIVLASGTLSPIDSFEQELEIKFPFVVQGRHVIPPSNVFVSAVSAGPQNVCLRGTYDSIHTFQYQDELGRVILETAKIVPQGVLVFFPSYTLMEKLKQRWEATGLLSSLSSVKQIFWEPRFKREMDEIMQDYEFRIEESSRNPDEEISALMFGVFRGKIAEGIDFPDHFARVVISVGIPFPNKNAKDVELKMKFNDSRKIALNGSRWYSIQAYRALNQAIGRCLRHKNDWGAIILLDSRFSNEQSPIQNLPKWIQSQVKHFSSFNNYKQSLSNFCDRMKKEDV